MISPGSGLVNKQGTETDKICGMVVIYSFQKDHQPYSDSDSDQPTQLLAFEPTPERNSLFLLHKLNR